MCGICGYYLVEGKLDYGNTIVEMTDTLTHRGPDEEGYFRSPRVCLGHRRLSIIDLKGGQQPIYNEDRSKIIIFNGEIYNFQEIREKLISKGHIFTTRSDTETILHLYEEEGIDCVKQLRGMFAFVIYDIRNHIIFVGRDRLGIKPLYYSYDNGRFFFGSEIKAILKSNQIDKAIDIEAFSDYITYSYIPAPKSIFSKIRKLPAGHTLLIQNRKISISQYWDLKFEDTSKLSEEDWIEKLNILIKDSIRMRMISEVPLGGFLSGGVDSSYIIGMMSKLSDKPVISSSIGFKEVAFDELKYARQIAKRFKTKCYENVVDMDCSGILDLLAWHYDEPFADSSAYPTYMVSKMTRKQVTVALSGDGGDENFAGYRRYYFDVLENKLRSKIPSFLRHTFIRALATAYPKADWLPQVFRAKTLLTNLSMDPVWGYYNTMANMSSQVKREILNPEICHKLNGYSSLGLFKGHYNRVGTDDLLSKIQYVDIKTYLVDDILTKVDRASMANSLEVRVPLLDHKVMECIATIPSNLKLNGKIGKYIFKEASRTFLPDNILDRKKKGFSVPLDIWFRKNLKNVVDKEVFVKNSYSAQYFNLKKLGGMWSDHQRGIRNYGTQFWMVLMFEKWAKKYL